jgi:hypothetical protein
VTSGAVGVLESLAVKGSAVAVPGCDTVEGQRSGDVVSYIHHLGAKQIYNKSIT